MDLTYFHNCVPQGAEFVQYTHGQTHMSDQPRNPHVYEEWKIQLIRNNHRTETSTAKDDTDNKPTEISSSSSQIHQWCIWRNREQKEGISLIQLSDGAEKVLNMLTNFWLQKTVVEGLFIEAPSVKFLYKRKKIKVVFKCNKQQTVES